MKAMTKQQLANEIVLKAIMASGATNFETFKAVALAEIIAKNFTKDYLNDNLTEILKHKLAANYVVWSSVMLNMCNKNAQNNAKLIYKQIFG